MKKSSAREDLPKPRSSDGGDTLSGDPAGGCGSPGGQRGTGTLVEDAPKADLWEICAEAERDPEFAEALQRAYRSSEVRAAMAMARRAAEDAGIDPEGKAPEEVAGELLQDSGLQEALAALAEAVQRALDRGGDGTAPRIDQLRQDSATAIDREQSRDAFGRILRAGSPELPAVAAFR